MRCRLELESGFSRNRALGFIGLGVLLGGVLIDVDHPIYAAIQGKSIFELANWLVPHGRFMHVPILFLSGALLLCSASFLVGWLLG